MWNPRQVNALIIQQPSGVAWRWDDYGGPLTITYSFIRDPGCYYDVTEYGPGSAFSGALYVFDTGMMSSIEGALQTWERYTNVDFIRVSEPNGPVASAGDIRFGLVDWDRLRGLNVIASPPKRTDDAQLRDIRINVGTIAERSCGGATCSRRSVAGRARRIWICRHSNTRSRPDSVHRAGRGDHQRRSLGQPALDRDQLS